jgi:hypothetical protein
MLATPRESAKSGWLRILTGCVAEVNEDNAHIIGPAPAHGQPGKDSGGDVTVVLGVGADRSGCIGVGIFGRVVVAVL